jgi:peptidyl-dipeptidase Dcp
MAASLAKSKNSMGFTLDFRVTCLFVTYVDNRELRKEIAIAAGKKIISRQRFDNKENVKRIVELRHKRANWVTNRILILFWKNEWLKILKKSVVLNDLLEKAKPAAQKEFVQLTAFAKN